MDYSLEIDKKIRFTRTLQEDILGDMMMLAIENAKNHHPGLKECVVSYTVNGYNDEDYYKCIDYITIDNFIVHNHSEHEFDVDYMYDKNTEEDVENEDLKHAFKVVAGVFLNYKTYLNTLTHSVSIEYGPYIKITWGEAEYRT